MKVVLQDEISECGLACIAMVCSQYGLDITLRSLRNRYPVKIDSGLSFFDLMGIADDLGLRSRGLKFEAHEIDALKTPCILHWGMNHFVVLKKVAYGNVIIIDPALGERKMPLAQAFEYITGYALELNPDVGFVKGQQGQKITLRDYASTLTGLRGAVWLVIVAGLALQVLTLLSPAYVQMTIDEAIKKSDVDILYLLTIIFGLLFLFEIIYGYLVGNIKSYLRNTVSQQLTSGVVSHLARLPISYYMFRNTGDTLSRVHSVQEVGNFLVDGFIGAVLDAVLCVLTLALMFYYSPMMAGITLAGMVLFAASRLWIQARMRDALAQALTRGAEADAVLIENVRSAHSIKLLSSETVRSNMWANAFTQRLQATREQERLQLVFDAISKGIIQVEQLVIVTYGAWLVMQGQLTIGVVYAFMQYKNMFAQSFVNYVQLFLQRKILQVHMDRVADILEADTEDPAKDASVTVPERLDGSISVRGLSYTPRGADNEVLSNVSLEVAPGEKIVIVGRTGSGKTTLLNLICALYPAPEGTVHVHRTDLAHVNVREFRKSLAAVTQSDQLFRGTIRQNITNFSPTARDSRMLEVAKLACIHDEIEALDHGYDTVLGDTQKFLSAGQVQRLLIARALYGNPSLLVLDEFTSNLDGETSQAIARNIFALPCTVLLATHDPQILGMADRIYRMHGRTLTDITATIRGGATGKPQQDSPETGA